MARRTKERKLRKFNSRMQASLLLVFCIIIIVFLVLIGRLFYLNNTDGDRYTKKVLSQQTYSYSTIPYKRGTITDRNGTVLAKSVKVYNLILDPYVMLEKEEYLEPTKEALKKAFDIDVDEVERLVNENSSKRYIVFEKGLSYEHVKKFQELEKNSKGKVKGVWFEHDYVRTYPFDTLASTTIGFTFKGNVGNNGIEGYYNDELNGTNGSQYGYFDSGKNLDRTVKPASNGDNITSTLDVNVQQIVEKYIKKFNEEIGSKNTEVLITDPNSGEILAMASSNTYNLNNPRDLTGFSTEEEIKELSKEGNEEELQKMLEKMWRNTLISDTFEPGSTFKPLTVAAALEEGVVHDGDTFYCDGYEKYEGIKAISCARKTGHGTITLAEAIAYSCNDAMMQIVHDKLHAKLFDHYQRIFSIGTKSGIDLPGEAEGIVYHEDQLGVAQLATSSFGQSLSVSMVQLMAAFQSVINGGYYYQPHIMKQITTESGAVVKDNSDVLVKRTVSEKTSELLRGYMEQAVVSGTAKDAAVEGYSIGGKTGTAQKYPRSEGNFVVSFIGFAPVDNPQIAIYVVVDEPNEENVVKQADSTIATKFAHNILTEVLPALGVFPEEEVDSATVTPGDATPIKDEDKKSDEDNKDSEVQQSEDGVVTPTIDPEETDIGSAEDDFSDYTGYFMEEDSDETKESSSTPSPSATPTATPKVWVEASPTATKKE